MTLLTARPSRPAVGWEHHTHVDRFAEVVVQPVGTSLRIVVGDLVAAGSASADFGLAPEAGSPPPLDRRGRLVDPCLQVAVDEVCRRGGWQCALGVDLAGDGTVTVAASGGPGAIVVGAARPARLVPEVPDGRPHVVRLSRHDVLVLCTPAYLTDPPAALRRLRRGDAPSAALRRALLDPARPGAVVVVRRALRPA